MVQRDRFTAGATCELTRGTAHVERQALVLQLPPKVDTANAVYRIDAQAAHLVADDRPALAQQGFLLWKDDISNPSGALIRIPLDRLDGARVVRAETGQNGRVWTWRVEGLAAALRAAQAEGCPTGK